MLTFLAGMEVDPAYMRRRLTASVGIGLVSFIGPFTVASVVAYLALDWTARASLIAGTALRPRRWRSSTRCWSSEG